jgi:predicted lipoprotein with Yx(FWY)xxD motif
MNMLVNTASRVHVTRAAMAIALTIASALPLGCAAKLDAKSANVDLPYPKEVSLILDEQHLYSYVQSSTSAPLYYYDLDTPEKSNCNEGCDSQWAPLWAPGDAKPLGQWTLISREEHRSQWVFDKHPIYVHIHDSAQAPNGDGHNGVWHLLPHFK